VYFPSEVREDSVNIKDINSKSYHQRYHLSLIWEEYLVSYHFNRTILVIEVPFKNYAPYSIMGDCAYHCIIYDQNYMWTFIISWSNPILLLWEAMLLMNAHGNDKECSTRDTILFNFKSLNDSDNLMNKLMFRPQTWSSLILRVFFFLKG
jgi:hypothetical protein